MYSRMSGDGSVGDGGVRETFTPGRQNKVWTAGERREELGARRGRRAMLFLRTFPFPLCAFRNVLEVSGMSKALPGKSAAEVSSAFWARGT